MSSEEQDRIELNTYLRKERLRRKEASRYLLLQWDQQVSNQTLARWASEETGPPHHKPGAFVLYPRIELDRWAEARQGPLLLSPAAGDDDATPPAGGRRTPAAEARPEA